MAGRVMGYSVIPQPVAHPGVPIALPYPQANRIRSILTRRVCPQKGMIMHLTQANVKRKIFT